MLPINCLSFFGGLLSIFLAVQAAAQSGSWTDIIASVEEKSNRYFEFAYSRGYSAAAGLNGIDSERHSCAIIGRMLGFTEEVRQAEYLDEPALSAEVDPYDQLLYAYSLDSWVTAAKYALGMSPTQRATIWNLDCVGRHEIPGDAIANSGQTQSEFAIDDRGVLWVYGDIDEGFSQRFVMVLNDNPQIGEVWLGSGGGSVKDAVLSGLEVRRRGLETQLFASCFSACPFIFAAGVRRTIFPDQGDLSVSIGFHQLSDGNGAISIDSPAYQEIAKYLDAMGSDGRRIVSWMLMALPDELYTPESEELCSVGLATFVYHICSQ
jgi:hypothetical protein